MSQESTFESPWPHEALHDFVLTIALDYSWIYPLRFSYIFYVHVNYTMYRGVSHMFTKQTLTTLL